MELPPPRISQRGPMAPQLPQWPIYPGQLLAEREEEPHGNKRVRVALACQRCKTRKQKCDGRNPCQKCKNSDAHCQYIVPPRPMPFGKNQYIKSLETRVAELETLLSSHGMSELDNDHWKTTSPSNGNGGNWEAAGSDQRSTSSSTEAGQLDSRAAILDWQDGSDSVVSILRSLSLDVNGSGYIGASSHMALGKLFTFLRLGRYRDAVSRHESSLHQGVPFAAPSTESSAPEVIQPIDLADVPNQVADRLFGGYLKHIATRTPVIYSAWARDVHQRRQRLSDIFETTVLHLVYATAGRFIETTGEFGMFHVKRHYVSAVQGLETILEYNDVRTVQVLMLMAIYCLRDNIGPGAWTCSRMALLIAIEHGLHRQTKALSQVTLEGELRKRLFWTCYAFDRQISIPMGRPFGISDRDIDLDFPLDVNEDATEQELANVEACSGTKPSISTSLTPFIVITRLRQIESDIQQTIYRVDRSGVVDESVVDDFLVQLEKWKSMIPQDTHNIPDVGNLPYDGYDFYMVFYYKCQRLLLYPLISSPNVAPRFMKECARACAGVCGAYRRLHQTLPVGYSFMAVQTVFMAGLTLAYCIWNSPGAIFDLTTSNGIHDCSIVLFVIAERVHAAKKYRNAFEVIRQRLIDQVTQVPSTRPLRDATATAGDAGAGAGAGAGARGLMTNQPTLSAVPSSDVNMHFEVENGGYEEFLSIITDITGEDFFNGINPFGGAMTAADPSGEPTAMFGSNGWTLDDSLWN